MQDAPHWFNEGLAEYFGIAEMTAKEYRYGQLPKSTPSRLSNIRDALSGQFPFQPFSLSELLRADSQRWGQHTAVNYAHAWSVCHFFGSSPRGRRILRDYFKALRRGLTIDACYEEVFGSLDIEALERSWRAYVGKLR